MQEEAPEYSIASAPNAGLHYSQIEQPFGWRRKVFGPRILHFRQQRIRNSRKMRIPRRSGYILLFMLSAEFHLEDIGTHRASLDKETSKATVSWMCKRCALTKLMTCS